MLPGPPGLIGPRAGRILAQNTRGSVLSSHATGVYCRFESGEILLLHDAAYGVIPFGLGIPLASGANLKEHSPGTTVANDVRSKTLTLGTTPYAYGEAFAPAPLLAALPPEYATKERLRQGVATAIPLLGNEGIAAAFMARRSRLFAAENPGPPVQPVQPAPPLADMWENALWEPVCALLAFCAGSSERTPEAVIAALLGLGPGLTPLGDDILCGFFHSCHALSPVFPGRAINRTIDTLAPVVITLSPGATTSQSVAFLTSAAAGETFGMLDALLFSLFSHNTITMREAFATTLDVGHTSGSGLLLGTLLAAEIAVEE